jgi:hypothetical protein
VGFSPDGRWLVTSDTNAYRFWAVGTWKERAWSIPCAGDNVYGAGPMAFSPDGRLLAVTWSIRQARLVDTRTGRPLATLSAGDDLTINSFAFSPDSTRLAVGLQDNTIQLWDLRALREQLGKIGLDWDQPPYPARKKSADAKPLQVRVVQNGALKPKLATGVPRKTLQKAFANGTPATHRPASGPRLWPSIPEHRSEARGLGILVSAGPMLWPNETAAKGRCESTTAPFTVPPASTRGPATDSFFLWIPARGRMKAPTVVPFRGRGVAR